MTAVSIDDQISAVERVRDQALPCDYDVFDRAAMSLRYLREYREMFVAVVLLKKAHPEFAVEMLDLVDKGTGDEQVQADDAGD